MRVNLMCLCLILLHAAPASAQIGYPLPDLQPITAANADALQVLATVENALPGDLAWSPDGSLLAVGTSAETSLYQTDGWEQSPVRIPEPGRLSFSSDHELLVDDHAWDTQTGERLTENSSASPEQPPVQVSSQADQTVVEFNGADGEPIRLQLGRSYGFIDLALSPNEQYAALALLDSVVVVQLWNLETRTLIATLPQRLELLDTLAFHADGDVLVIATTTDAIYGGIFADVQLWDGRTGESLGMDGYGYSSPPVRFSPDGQFMAFTTGRGLLLWGQQNFGTLPVTSRSATGVPEYWFSPDSSTLAIDAEAGVQLWALQPDALPTAPRLIIPAPIPIYSLVFSPDSRFISIDEGNGIISLWNVQTGNQQAVIHPSDLVGRPQFSPDSHLLKTSGYTDVTLWNVETGDVKLNMPCQAIFSSDWSRAACWQADHILIADIAEAALHEVVVIPNYLGQLTAYSSAAGRAIFVGSDVQMIDLLSGATLWRQWDDHQQSSYQFNADGTQFVRVIRPLVYGTGEPQIISLHGSDQPQPTLMQFEIRNGYGTILPSPDGRYLSQLSPACGEGVGGSIRLWDAETGELLAQLLDWQPCGPSAHTFTPNSQRLIVAGEDEVRLLNILELIETAAVSVNRIAPEEIGNHIRYGYDQRIEQIVLSPDGTRLAIIGREWSYAYADDPHRVTRVDVFTLNQLPTILEGAQLAEFAVTIPNASHALFNPNNSGLLTDTGLWDTTTGEQLANVSGEIAAFTSDGILLAVAQAESVTVWDSESFRQGIETPTITLPVSGVRSLSFSPDSHLLYLERDTGIQLWGIPEVTPP